MARPFHLELDFCAGHSTSFTRYGLDSDIPLSCANRTATHLLVSSLNRFSASRHSSSLPFLPTTESIHCLDPSNMARLAEVVASCTPLDGSNVDAAVRKYVSIRRIGARSFSGVIARPAIATPPHLMWSSCVKGFSNCARADAQAVIAPAVSRTLTDIVIKLPLQRNLTLI